jgi:hypothetical protein
MVGYIPAMRRLYPEARQGRRGFFSWGTDPERADPTPSPELALGTNCLRVACEWGCRTYGVPTFGKISYKPLY